MAGGQGPGSATGAPYYATTGTVMTHLEPGFVVTELRPGADVTDAAGRLLPGVAAAVADSALGASVYSLVGPDRVTQTVELRVDALPGVAGRSDRVAARGTAVHVGRTTALSRGEIVDGAGNLRALASCRCLVRPAAEGEFAALAAAAGADAFLLEPPGAGVLGGDEITSPTGLDSFLATGLARRLALAVETVSESTVVTRFPDAQGLTNMYGNVHGGAVALFCEVSIAVALHVRLREGSGIALLDLAVNFLRPVSAEGPLTAEAEVVHGGRRFAVVHTRLRNPDGRVAALASSTVYVDR